MRHPDLRIRRSVLSADRVAEHVRRHYELGSGLSCRLIGVGINDHYEVSSERGRWVFRVYQRDRYWARTKDENLFELEWLAHLVARGQPVSGPVRRRDGALIGSVEAPEGERFAAAFDWAAGARAYPPDTGQAGRLGELVAGLHGASDGFAGGGPRIRYDAETLVREPMRAVLEHWEGRRGEGMAVLESVVSAVEGAIGRLRNEGGSEGIIGGDFNGHNHFMDTGGRITFFDFDLCGQGWRVQDLAMFCWSMAQANVPEGVRTAFVAGYERGRRLSTAEREALRAFTAGVQLFMMGFHVKCARWAGTGFLKEGYWAGALGLLEASVTGAEEEG